MAIIKLNNQSISAVTALPAGVGGKIIQKVINRNTTGVLVTSDGTYVDTGVTATITPTSSSNKILVIPAMAFLQYQQNSDHRMNTNVRIVRGSTAVETWGNDAGTLGDVGIGTYSYDGNSVAQANIWSTIYEDTPNTTSSTTYKIQVSNINNKPQFGAQHGDKASTMTLLEVEA